MKIKMYKKNTFYLLCLMIFTISFSNTANAQIFSKKKKNQPTQAPPKKDKSKIKPYKDIITEKAVSSSGLITTHKVGENNYFEIGDSLLNKEILVVSRISGFVKGLNFGGAGTKSRPQQVIRFERKDDKILLREVSYNSIASEEKPIYESVRNNNFEPVIMVFDIKALGKGKNSVIIDVTPLFTTDVPMFGAMYDFQEKSFGIRGVDKKRSFIESMRSFPQNVEVRHVLTYNGSDKLPDNQLTGALSIELNQSFVLLPEEPMLPRLHDARVGYFSISQIDYGSEAQKAQSKRYITRWRLEPKDPDAYYNGELVEPVKPIIYYIDPATPTEWVPFLKQGIEDWQPAFEAAGFKNAIIAKEAPSKEEDPDWTPEVIRYSTIRYVSTDIQNAQGPHVHDPRTGEILESDIIWYHNVMNLLRNWYFIQTAAINPAARSVQFETAVMGQLIRFVSAHEVGHTLGLPHNMGSSVAYPVDSLRSRYFTKKMGTAPSIMDYARFNYVAQPEDGEVGLMPGVGLYDKWSIKYGYQLNRNVSTPEEDKKITDQWVLEKAGDPIYRFGRQRGLPLDPSAQTEDLGDNSVKASDYGIKNLKRIVPKLIEWTEESGKDFTDLNELYGQVYGQFNRYMGHVTANVGGVYEMYQTYDEDKPIYSHVSKERQREAMMFLNQQLFETPTWLIDKEIIGRIEPSGVISRIGRVQSRTLDILLLNDRLNRIIENEAINGNDAYGIEILFKDLQSGIFGASIDAGDSYKRNLQRMYVDKLIAKLESNSNTVKSTDISAVVRSALMKLKSDISSSANYRGTSLKSAHFQDLVARIDNLDKK